MNLPPNPRPADRARWLFPPAITALVALVFSVGVHVPAYVGLGVLSDLMAASPPEVASAPMEIEIVDARPTEPRETEDSQAVDEPMLAEDAPERPPPAARPAAPEPEAASRRPEPEAETPPVLPTPSVTPPRAQPPPMRETSVEHRSRDPNVEPPPDAEYLAEENSRVEEETQARIRNPNLDDPDPSPAPAEAPSAAAEDEGNADEEEVAELADAEGSDERDPTPEETRVPPRERPPPPSVSREAAVSEAARGAQGTGGEPRPSPPDSASGGGRQARGGGEAATTEVIVSDGFGSYRIRVPVRPEGSGAGEGGGPVVAGLGRGREGDGRASGRAGAGRRRGRGGAARGRGAPDLRMSWSQFASVYGEEELERDREAYLEQRRSTQRGPSRAERWERFRAAIENYDVRVRPGNQTALNTRADPFAAYIAAMHRRIHQRFAQSFLPNLPSTVDETFRGSPDMNTNLEIAVDAEGRVGHVSVVSSSGDTLFDLGAFESVMGAQPFPAPPENIRSPDGLVYMHWAFFRNHRQCGTFNARPFLLASAPTPRGRRDAREDTLLEPGSVFRAGDDDSPRAPEGRVSPEAPSPPAERAPDAPGAPDARAPDADGPAAPDTPAAPDRAPSASAPPPAVDPRPELTRRE